MHEITVNFHRYKLNEVACTCGYRQYFSNGVNTRYAADMHAKRNTPSTLKYLQDGAPIQPPGRVAKPGRHNGNSNSGSSGQ